MNRAVAWNAMGHGVTMKMGARQLLCLILGVLLLSIGGGMLGGRYVLERYGDASLERPQGAPKSFRTPDAKRPPAPISGETAGEPTPEAGDARETTSPPEILPVEGPLVAPAAEAPAGESRPEYVIQAMSTSNRDDASAARDTILAAGFDAGVFGADLPGRGSWYRVYVGPYEREGEARRAVEAVRSIPGFEGSFMKEMEQ